MRNYCGVFICGEEKQTNNNLHKNRSLWVISLEILLKVQKMALAKIIELAHLEDFNLVFFVKQ